MNDQYPATSVAGVAFLARNQTFSGSNTFSAVTTTAGLISNSVGITSAITGNSTSNLILKATTAGTQCGMQFLDGTTPEWLFFKDTTNTLNIRDQVGGVNQVVFTSGSSSSGTIVVNLATASTTSTSGAFQVVGGVGIGGNINSAGTITCNNAITINGLSSNVVLAVNAPTGFIPEITLGINGSAHGTFGSSAANPFLFSDFGVLGNVFFYTSGTASTGFWTFSNTGDATSSSVAAVVCSGGVAIAKSLIIGGALTVNSAVLIKSNTTLTNGAATNAGTLTNAPAIGNPTKWIPINDNGTTRYFPAW